MCTLRRIKPFSGCWELVLPLGSATQFQGAKRRIPKLSREIIHPFPVCQVAGNHWPHRVQQHNQISSTIISICSKTSNTSHQSKPARFKAPPFLFSSSMFIKGLFQYFSPRPMRRYPCAKECALSVISYCAFRVC